MRITKGIYLIFAGILLSHFCFAQIVPVTFEQLDSLQNREKRPVVIFVHTSWCKYCSTMKNTTLKNNEVVNVLNQRYYFVSLDAEEKADIRFRGHIFRYKPTGANAGLHELAEQLGMMNGELSYPSLCFLDADYGIIFQQQGYLSAKQLLPVLKQLKTPNPRDKGK